MTRETATIRIMSMTAWDSEPALTSEELEVLVDLAQRADVDGLPPSDAGWTPTYDLNAAASEGWRWKAAKAASKFDTNVGGQGLSRSQIITNCRAMADEYRRKVIAQVPVYGAMTTPYTREQVS